MFNPSLPDTFGPSGSPTYLAKGIREKLHKTKRTTIQTQVRYSLTVIHSSRPLLVRKGTPQNKIF
jgi:hypothetical protein